MLDWITGQLGKLGKWNSRKWAAFAIAPFMATASAALAVTAVPPVARVLTAGAATLVGCVPPVGQRISTVIEVAGKVVSE